MISRGVHRCQSIPLHSRLIKHDRLIRLGHFAALIRIDEGTADLLVLLVPNESYLPAREDWACSSLALLLYERFHVCFLTLVDTRPHDLQPLQVVIR